MPVPSGLCLVLATNGTLGENPPSAITQQLSRSIFAQIYFRGFGYLPDIFILFSKFYLRKISRDFALAFAHQILDCIKVIKTLDTFQGKLTLIAKGL